MTLKFPFKFLVQPQSELFEHTWHCAPREDVSRAPDGQVLRIPPFWYVKAAFKKR